MNEFLGFLRLRNTAKIAVIYLKFNLFIAILLQMEGEGPKNC
jgi:hypothetical protein